MEKIKEKIEMNIIAFDVETGGTDENKHSLLQAYFTIHDKKTLKQIDELDLWLKPDNGEIIAEPEALKITGINLEAHLADPRTVTISEGRKKLEEFLERNKVKGKRKSLMPLGHNVSFDKDFIFTQLLPKEIWEKNVHYRTLDTFVLVALLQEAGLFPEELGSLGSIVEYLGIPQRKAHTAKDDTLMTVEAYSRMINTLKSLKPGNPGNDIDILKILEFKE